MYETLAGFCEGGRRVQIMTNAIESGANPFGCTDYLNEKKNILATGSEVFEVSCGAVPAYQNDFGGRSQSV